jgi:hypothetical protein
MFLPTNYHLTLTNNVKDYIHDNYIKFSFVDRYIFGFQKGKCAHMVVGEIAATLDSKIEKVYKVSDN